MKIKIISDGTNHGTKIVDQETGEPLGFVQNVKWEVDVNDMLATAVLTIIKVPVEITADANISEVFPVSD